MNKLLYIKANYSMLNMPGPDIRPLSISGQISGNIFFLYVAFHDMIVAFFQQGQNGPDFGMGKIDVVC